MHYFPDYGPLIQRPKAAIAVPVSSLVDSTCDEITQAAIRSNLTRRCVEDWLELGFDIHTLPTIGVATVSIEFSGTIFCSSEMHFMVGSAHCILEAQCRYQIDPQGAEESLNRGLLAIAGDMVRSGEPILRVRHSNCMDHGVSVSLQVQRLDAGIEVTRSIYHLVPPSGIDKPVINHSICETCLYFSGEKKLSCAVHPNGPSGNNCKDYDQKN